MKRNQKEKGVVFWAAMLVTVIFAGTTLIFLSRANAHELSMKHEHYCMALNMYWEARSEGIVGMLAVGHVTLQRVKSSKFPNTICAVVTEKGAFSWYWDGKSDHPKDKEAWKKATYYAEQMIEGRLALEGIGPATYYHADYVDPNWPYRRTGKIGKHIFYADED